MGISRRISAVHAPYGLILETRFASADTDRILRFEGAGDSALWTGVYLAAESYRYAATRSTEALEAVRTALRGVESVSRVSGSGLLARTVFPVDSPYVESFKRFERHHRLRKAVHQGREVYWADNISRDQYAGVFFGLSLAYELVDDKGVRETASDLMRTLAGRLLKHGFLTINPGGKVSTSFALKPEQRLAILLAAARADPGRFRGAYERHRRRHAGSVPAAVWLEMFGAHKGYFKFNLAHLYLFTLIRLEEDPAGLKLYRKAFAALRRTVRGHGNAHFNMIDRALNGADEARDQETRDLLKSLLARGFRDHLVDNGGSYKACGRNRACAPLPVEHRPYADFLWQRSPFQLWGGSDGSKESPGLDYLLPYWMGRYYGVLKD